MGSALNRRWFMLLLLAGLSIDGQAAETYPQRPIRFLIPQSPGGASDTVGRIVAQRLAERLGQHGDTCILCQSPNCRRHARKRSHEDRHARCLQRQWPVSNPV